MPLSDLGREGGGAPAASPDTGQRTGRAPLAERPAREGTVPGAEFRRPRAGVSLRSTDDSPAFAPPRFLVRAAPRMTTRLAVGIGCRAGVTADAIDAAIHAALACAPGATAAQIAVVATVEDKAREPGLLACCARRGWPLAGFPRAALAARLAAASAHDFSAPSAAARARLGVDGVCEPCARLAAHGAALRVRKLRHAGVTVALAGPF